MPQRVDSHSRHPPGLILLINGGSSSLKLAVSTFSNPPRMIFRESIAFSDSNIGRRRNSTQHGIVHIPRTTTRQLTTMIHSALMRHHIEPGAIQAVGHRIVLAGPALDRHQIITPRVRRQLNDLIEFDPQHLPMELALLDACNTLLPDAAPVACFDSVFHNTMPTAAKVLPIPWRYFARGVRRYGFHGLSYASLLRQLRKLDAAASRGRVIMAHLGSGCSLAAVRGGKSVATTMGFTPLAGVTMGHRTGDIDPGVMLYLMKRENISHAGMEAWMDGNCGLAGIAGSGDMKVLLSRRNERARLAVEIFCRRIAGQIGSYAAELDGIDAVVFSGGIGEHSSAIRRHITGQLRHLGIQLHATANRNGAEKISRPGKRPAVWCLKTDEELEMGHIIVELLQAGVTHVEETDTHQREKRRKRKRKRV
ncbi:MAG: acetate/propionate family kinase [Phycisphaerae bacterium]